MRKETDLGGVKAIAKPIIDDCTKKHYEFCFTLLKKYNKYSIILRSTNLISEKEGIYCAL